MSKFRFWVTKVLVVTMLRGELKGRPHHPSKLSVEPRIVAERLESLLPLKHHHEHIHDEVSDTAEGQSETPAELPQIKVSVVTPLYNVGSAFSTLWRTQTPPWHSPTTEAIPVDDSSADDTANELAATHESGFRPVYLTSNRGYSEAARYGIEAASGDYVVIADLDIVGTVTTFEPLLEPLRSGAAELTILGRPRRRTILERLILVLVALRLSVRLSDMYPGCWAVRKTTASQLAKQLPPGDLFLGAVHWLARSRGRAIEVPVDLCRT